MKSTTIAALNSQSSTNARNQKLKMSLTFSPSLGNQLAPSPTLQINERVARMWAAGQTVYHLGFGESRFPAHPKIVQALAANGGRKSYLPGVGIPELRQTVADFYSRQFSRQVSADQVIVAPGSKALLFAFQMALDGATVLPTPSWVSYAPQARLINRPVLRIPSSPEDGHRLHPQRLEQLLQDSDFDQHLLILNSPNNPTGQIFEPALLEEIAAICRKHDVLILSDEIYALTAFGREHISISHYYPEGTVVLGGLSKHLSLGGWRLGTAVVPPAESGQRLLQAIAKIGSELWSTTAAPIQYAAVTAYGDDPELAAYIEQCTGLHAARTRYLWRGLCELDVPCAEPMGGFYLFPNFDHWRVPLAARGVYTSTDLARYLLDELQIATLPGGDFGTPATELSLRLSTSYVDLETDEKAARILELADGSRSYEELLLDSHPGMNEVLARFRSFLSALREE